MTHLKEHQSIFFLSAEKDVLKRAFANAPECRERDVLLAVLERTGMSDTHVALAPPQRDYIREHGMTLMAHESLKGTKLDNSIAREIMRSIVRRCGGSFAAS